MEKFKEEGKSVGLIFDVSVRHCKNGKRIIDVVKKQIIEVIRKYFDDGEDDLYLYHPEIVESVALHGEQVCSVGNYDTDGWKFNMSWAFRQTLYVLMSEDLTHRKYLFFITDRFDEPHNIEKAFQINEKEMIDCNFVFIGIGKNYNKKYFEEISKKSNVKFYHLQEPENLVNYIFKEREHGSKNACCEADEQCERLLLTSGHSDSFSRAVRPSDASNSKLVQGDQKQLLPVISSGRLLSEPGISDDDNGECKKERQETEKTEYIENSAS